MNKKAVLFFSVFLLMFLITPFSSLRAAAPTSGLIGYWNLNEGTGTTAGDTAGTNPGTLTNNPAWIVGKVSNGLQFNSTENGNDSDDPRVTIGIGTGFNVSLPFTISAWVNPTNYSDYRTIFSKRSAWSSTGMRFDFTLNIASGKVFFGSSVGSRLFNYAPPTNTWTHLTVVVTSSATTLYVNGVQNQSLGAITLGNGITANTVIGGNGEPLSGGDNDPFKGGIDEVRVYNRALSASEITSVYTDTGSSDTQAPTVPTNLSANVLSASQINLSWTPSTDNVGVVGYKVFRNGVQVGTPTTFPFANINLSPATTYSFYISAYDAAGNVSGDSTTIFATTHSPDTTPPVISAVSTTGISQTSATVNWTTDEVATSQVNYGQTTSYNFQTPLDSSLVLSHSQILTNLSPNTLYNFQILSADVGGHLALSNNFTFTTLAPVPDTQVPTVPINLSATAISTSQINLSWTASSDNVGVAGYKVFRDGAQVATTTTTTFSNTGLNPSTLYSYTVSAFDLAGNVSGQSTSASATTQTPDTTAPIISVVSASGITNSTTLITWTTNEPSDSQIQYGTTLSYGFQTTLNSSLVTSHSQPLSGLQPNTMYHYRVLSKDAALNLSTSGDFTFTTSATPPPAPTYVQNACSQNGNSLSVNSVGATLNNIGAGDLIVVWVKYEGAATTMTVSDGTSTLISGIRTDHSNGDLHGQFFYLLSANAGTRTYTATFNAARKYATIMVWHYSLSGGVATLDNQASNSGTSAAMTSGSISTIGQNDVAVVGYGEYSVYGVSGVQVAGQGIAHTLSATSASCSGPGGNYTQSWDRTFNSAFIGGATANLAGSAQWVLNLVAFKVDSGVPDTTAPIISGVSSSGITQNSANISWTTDEASDSQVEYGFTTAYGSQTILNSSPVTSHLQTISGLSSNTTYHYRVLSKDASNNQAVSGDFSFTTTAPPPLDTQAPTVPTNLSATAISTSQINLSWTASSDNVGVVGYRVYRGGLFLNTTSGTTFSDTNLTASTTYSYAVLAYDAATNESAQSSSASATTLAQSSSGIPTLVQAVNTTNSKGYFLNTYTVRLPNVTLPGNTMVLAVQRGVGGGALTVSDDKGNVYNLARTNSDSSQTVSVYYATNLIPGAQVISLNFAGAGVNYLAAVAAEFYNVSSVNALDATSANSGTNTQVSAGGLITTSDNDLIFQYATQDADANPTAWTQGANPWQLLTADYFDSQVSQYQVQSVHGAITPTLSQGSSKKFNSVAIALRPAQQGTAPSGMRIVHLTHNYVPKSPPGTFTLQTPSTGNLIVVSWIGTPGCNINVSPDSNGNAYTSTGPGFEYQSSGNNQIYYAGNANTSTTMSGPTLSVSNCSAASSNALIYDIAGAATSPYDIVAGRPTASGDQSVAGDVSTVTITPSTANGIIITSTAVSAHTMIGVTPGNFLSTEPTPDINTGQIDNNNAWAMYYNPNTNPVTFVYDTKSGQLDVWASIAAAFKAAGN